MAVRLYADQRACSLCTKPAELGRKGWCSSHYQLWRKYGDPLMRIHRPDTPTVEEAFRWFMPNGPPTGDCWDWTSNVNTDGYGHFSWSSHMFLAHRISHQVFIGPPDGFCVLHSCDRPICVQPAHLSLNTHQANIIQAIERGLKPTKLTPADVALIRESSLSDRDLGQMLDVSRQTVNDARIGRTWKHLL